MNKYFFTLIVFSFLSCSNKKTENKFISNNNVLNDTLITRYNNGNVMMKGVPINKENRVQIWEFYDSLGVKKKYFEYRLVKSKKYLNRSWELNKKGDTIGGVHYKYFFQNDTLNYGGLQKIGIYLNAPVFSHDSEVFFLIPQKMNELMSDFSNYEEIEYDTIRSSNDISNRYVTLSFKAMGIGDFNIKGVLVEKFDEKIPDAKFSIRKYFFDHSFYVRDTIK